ncbi:PREDICTED: tubulin polyglutamylase TTLL4 [Drosophila arizonae]|uniref:Tubulin polyglutamylase TTLL4 n=1 Tax=Drosophila arizonae TaxID=7263 RepID=A0ABM1NM13_DROAR|nr:PREDICTED: tubulin polyglutamylase TTLL4 [Drosophila arizonae]
MKSNSESEAPEKLDNETKLSGNCTKLLSLKTIPLGTVMLFLAATVGTGILIELLPHYAKIISERNSFNVTTHKSPHERFYSIYSTSPTEEHLVHVVDVLNRFGYKRVELNENWDLLWAHDYPFRVFPHLKNLEAHQFVNHLPGCGYLTNKVDLCTTKLPFLPRAFRLPSQRDAFLEYASAHPEALFVQKHNEHRHIKVRSISDIDLNSNDSFVQEFIENPFLVDGHKFDIGVYVVITSVNPLRVYIYHGDVLFRYCPEKYYPFDAEIEDKYVVGDNYLPTWEVPSLRKYYNSYGGSMRASFEAYVRDQAMDPSKIWPQVENIIRTTILSKEEDLIDSLRRYRRHNFFDLLRFDLFIDENLEVHLMEANMSPNLSSAHFKQNTLLYEQVLYSVFNLVGIRPVSQIGDNRNAVSEIIAADKNLATGLNKCAYNDCDKSCNKEECSLCLPCISGTEYEWLQRAHDEHLHRVDMKRIFPKPINDIQTFDIDAEARNLSIKNAWITRWFFNKCQYDRTWCM